MSFSLPVRGIRRGVRWFSAVRLREGTAVGQPDRDNVRIDTQEPLQVANNDMRDLLVNLMHTSPSKRELQHFLKRYVPQPALTPHSGSTKTSLSSEIRAPGVQAPKDYVNALLAPDCRDQIALTKVQGPFEKSSWQAVGSTLYKLQKLGLTSIVVADNTEWASEKSPVELCRRMTRESMVLVEAIEKAGGRARPIYFGVLEQTDDDGQLEVRLDFIQSALDSRQIPVLVPIATRAGMQHPVKANDTMVALTTHLLQKSRTRHHSLHLSPNLTPAKLVVVNSTGGIPNHERPGTAHSLVNVQEEYDTICSAWRVEPAWQESHPNALTDLAMIRSCLAKLPTSSSAVMVPTTSLPSALIANLVTDKPLYSSSLPLHTNASTGHPELQRVNQMRTTVLRHGIKIQSYKELSQLDLPRLTTLLEASFQKKLNTDAFYHRLESVLAGAIIAGDYEGAVIMTQEGSGAGHHYLDKFAIAPTSQGIGLTDILWRRMCDAYPNLFWRSRQDNGVNKWYFERSSGYLRLQHTKWVLFWHGANGSRHLEQYANIAKSIPASFV